MLRWTQSGAVVLAMSAGWATATLAQDLPAWSLAEICGRDPQQCAMFEARARQSVTGGWGVLPETYKKACLAEIKTPPDRSWRLLSQCLEQQVLKGLDKQAIATAATPAEPVPPAKPALVESSGVPPPPFPLPTAPPPFALPVAPPKAE